ncbi:LysR family transcriptional regulator [Actinoplanes sp. NPDC051411]|uniref:LysR family transcriptional regulator n=1 Tax=Actinoplanes sp. NPDC051411 TaxID=3155522 RepID=UPI003448B4D5
MQIEDLRGLLALGEHEHVTSAAAALGISQPNLSRLLSRVEAELGARLFERDARGAHPNPLGSVTLDAARDLVERYDRLRRDLGGLLDPDAGTVRLAFLDSMSTSLVPRLLRDVRASAPLLRVELRQEPGHEIMPHLATGVAELAIVSGRPAAPHGWRALQEQRLVVVVPAGHRFAGRRRLRLADLEGEDFVSIPPGFGFREHLDGLFAEARVAPRIAFEIGDLATIEGLVGAGLGVAVVPEQFAGASGTVGVPLANPGASRVIGLTWRADRTLAPAAARFLAIVSAAGPY